MSSACTIDEMRPRTGASAPRRRWTQRDAHIVVPPRRNDVVAEALDGQIILSDPDDGATHRLNASATAVWQHCDGRTTTRQIAETITKEYDVDFDTALDHVEQVLVLLAELRMLESPCH